MPRKSPTSAVRPTAGGGGGDKTPGGGGGDKKPGGGSGDKNPGGGGGVTELVASSPPPPDAMKIATSGSAAAAAVARRVASLAAAATAFGDNGDEHEGEGGHKDEGESSGSDYDDDTAAGGPKSTLELPEGNLLATLTSAADTLVLVHGEPEVLHRIMRYVYAALGEGVHIVYGGYVRPVAKRAYDHCVATRNHVFDGMGGGLGRWLLCMPYFHGRGVEPALVDVPMGNRAHITAAIFTPPLPARFFESKAAEKYRLTYYGRSRLCRASSRSAGARYATTAQSSGTAGTRPPSGTTLTRRPCEFCHWPRSHRNRRCRRRGRRRLLLRLLLRRRPLLHAAKPSGPAHETCATCLTRARRRSPRTHS